MAEMDSGLSSLTVTFPANLSKRSEINVGWCNVPLPMTVAASLPDCERYEYSCWISPSAERGGTEEEEEAEEELLKAWVAGSDEPGARETERGDWNWLSALAKPLPSWRS